MSTCQSDTGQIERVLLKHPRDAFGSQAKLTRQWQELNYLACPDYAQAIDEYDQLVGLLEATGARIDYLPPDEALSLDSVYVRDALVVTDRGVILCNMGKEARAAEPEAAAKCLLAIDQPILGRITPPGRLEGGDLIWLDRLTLVVGQGYRTNAEGISQLRALTAGLIDQLIVVPLPHWNGAGDVMHLMSNISPIASDLAVVYSRLLPVPFRQILIERGITLVEVPDKEYASMACNVLALAPRKAVMLDGNPVTRQRLREQGAEVLTYKGDEISRRGSGGPTCLTRPLQRKSDGGDI